VGAPGICGDGQQECVDDGFGNGIWDPCVPDFLPGALPEDCSFPGDEDCDGLSDCSDGDCAGDPACAFGTTCVPGAIASCTVSGVFGRCADGEQTCDISGSSWGACAQVWFPAVEDCSSGLDEDCDGDTDCSDSDCSLDPACVSPPPTCVPGAIASCTVSGLLGLCAKGQQTCDVSGTFWGVCTQINFPASEDCSSTEDEDCDGSTSCSDTDCATSVVCAPPTCVPGAIASCVVGGGLLGECNKGEQTCDISGTSWGSCTQVNFPLAEDCSNVADDDCDGSTDCSDSDCLGDPACPLTSCTIGTFKPCGYNDIGGCAWGSEECVDDGFGVGIWSGVCIGAIYPVAEDCGNGLDDDCDTYVDLLDPDCGSVTCTTPGATRSCGYSSVGECALGIQTCVAGFWTACVGAVYPTDEICGDGLDQDCDGTADELCVTTSCTWTPARIGDPDCDAPAVVDPTSVEVFGWIKGLLGTVQAWFPFPCIIDPISGQADCTFYFQQGSELEMNIYWWDPTPLVSGGGDSWYLECPGSPSCDPTDPASIWQQGSWSCLSETLVPVTFSTILNFGGTGFNDWGRFIP